MAEDDEPILDAWTPLSFKRALGNKKTAGISWTQPTWVGDHARRLQAYCLLQAIISNAARFWLSTTDEKRRDAHREYGDAALIRDSILTALLGEDQRIVTDGADDFDPDLPDDADDDAKAANAEAQAAADLQDWLEEVAGKDERLGLKIIENERNTVGLGDGVYTIGWSDEKQRPRIRVFDPGFYFPVLEDGNEDDFPLRVHIAWEVDSEEAKRKGKRRVRRLTWEMMEMPDGATRLYPWNDKPSAWCCYWSDGTWEFDIAGKQQIDDFTEGTVTWEPITVDGEEIEAKEIDLKIDFLPVVHLPNTVALLNHFGRSSVSLVAQILDDLANADTDLQAASATTGKPPIALSNATLGSNKPSYKPGEVWELGKDGRMDVLDTSRSLDALLKYIDALLERLSVNTRLPASLLGRVKPSDVPSGIALALSFGPLKAMIQEMRLVREEKNPLLLKFFHRMALAGEMADVPPEWIPSNIRYGRFLPEDVKATIDMVTELLQTKPAAISLETAVRMLMEAGLPIEDVVEEILRIQERDFEGASALLDATGDEDAVFEYLNREKPATPPPAPAAPAVPGAPVVDPAAVAPTVPAAPGQGVPTPPVAPTLPPA